MAQYPFTTDQFVNRTILSVKLILELGLKKVITATAKGHHETNDTEYYVQDIQIKAKITELTEKLTKLP